MKYEDISVGDTVMYRMVKRVWGGTTKRWTEARVVGKTPTRIRIRIETSPLWYEMGKFTTVKPESLELPLKPPHK